MNNSSLRVQLSAVFLGFLLLVISSVAVTFWLVQTQQNDAAIINLAGRQRMLLQQMSRLALTDPGNPELGQTVERFEQTMTALADGGEVVAGNGRSLTLSPPTNPAIQTRLDAVAAHWSSYKTHLQPLLDTDLLQADFATLLVQLDSTVSAYEAEAQAKIARLRWVQIIFLVAAFLLLAWGYRLVHHQFIRPLAALGTAAREIGAGNLEETMPTLPGKEFSQLGQTMERMRGEISAHQNTLEQRVAQRTQELTTAFAFSQEIVRELEPAQLLQSVADHTRDLMQGTAVSVCMLNGGCEPEAAPENTLALVAGSGPSQQHIGLRQSTNRGIALPVIQEQKTVVAEGGCTNCVFLHNFPGQPCAAAPLQVGGRALGALCVVRAQEPFDDDEIRVLTLLANAAAVALENTRLIESSQRQAEENAALAERERLAANLHDNLAQTLGAMHLSADVLANRMAAAEDELVHERLAELQANLRKAYTQVRMALIGLREPSPDETQFMTTAQAILADFEATTGLPIQLSVKEKEGIWITAVSQKQALHILREALANIRRHAQATQVQIHMIHNDDAFTLEIVDDGCGFDASQVDSQSHLGLSIMRARAERCQGTLTIHSTRGEGTRVTAVFPTSPAREQQPEAA